MSLNAQKILWEDNFTDNSHAWEIHNEELRHSEIADNKLIDWNGERNKTAINVTEISSAGMNDYIITAKLSNLHCEKGKKYPQYSKGKNGNIKKYPLKISHPEWGFTWDFKNDSNYHAILFKYDTKKRNNFEDKKFIFCKIFSVTNGNTTVLKDWNCNNCYSYDYKSNDNTVNIVKEENLCKIFVGKDGQSFAGSFKLTETGGKKAGIIIGTGAKVILKQLTTKQTIKQRIRESGWNEESIREKVKNRPDNPIEGIWKAVSFRGDTTKFVPGGKYIVGIVKDKQTYKIVYLSGLPVKAFVSWKSGMLKGICKQSEGNINLFSGEWIGPETEVFGPVYMGIDNKNDELIIAFDKETYLRLERISEISGQHI